MKYLHQLCLIFGFSFLGEVLNRLIPLPIPASIYGMVLLFLALSFKMNPLDAVKGAGAFLTSCLPVLFVVSTVGLLDHWSLLQDALIPVLLILLLTTVVTFAISGRIAQWVMDRKENGHV